ncbi:hypothetical protein HAX54_044741, partial [Datura stramonium]|nr:hypothetical protein [Datura stramonium]
MTRREGDVMVRVGLRERNRGRSGFAAELSEVGRRGRGFIGEERKSGGREVVRYCCGDWVFAGNGSVGGWTWRGGKRRDAGEEGERREERLQRQFLCRHTGGWPEMERRT